MRGGGGGGGGDCSSSLLDTVPVLSPFARSSGFVIRHLS